MSEISKEDLKKMSERAKYLRSLEKNGEGFVVPCPYCGHEEDFSDDCEEDSLFDDVNCTKCGLEFHIEIEVDVNWMTRVNEKDLEEHLKENNITLPNPDQQRLI